MSDFITRFLASKINNLLARGVAKLLESSGNWQLTLLNGETISGIEHPQEFGMASKAPNGGGVIAISIGGQRENTIAVTVSNTTGMPTVSQGQTAIHDAHGSYLLLDNAGTIHIYSDNGIIVHGNVSDLQGTAQTMEAMRLIFNAHVHTTVTGTTSAPTTTM